VAGKTDYKNKWQAENCDRVNLTIKKGSKQALQSIAAELGESVNGYIKNAVKARYEADTGEEIEL
jgi:hypothetical protein